MHPAGHSRKGCSVAAHAAERRAALIRAACVRLQTTLQLRDREAKERHATHEAASKQVVELQRHLEEERRHKAGTESEHQAVSPPPFMGPCELRLPDSR